MRGEEKSCLEMALDFTGKRTLDSIPSKNSFHHREEKAETAVLQGSQRDAAHGRGKDRPKQ